MRVGKHGELSDKAWLGCKCIDALYWQRLRVLVSTGWGVWEMRPHCVARWRCLLPSSSPSRSSTLPPPTLNLQTSSHRTFATTRRRYARTLCWWLLPFVAAFPVLPMACFIHRAHHRFSGYYVPCMQLIPFLPNPLSQGSSMMMLAGCRSAGSSSSRRLLGRAGAQAAASSPSCLLHPHPSSSTTTTMASALGSRRHISDKLFIRST